MKLKEEIDFYDPTSLKAYNLNESMRYQLNTLDQLDVFTRKHSESVANLACRICEELHLRTDYTIYVTMCAYLHDIGKIFIPPAVLQKPGKLTEEEYAVIKTHVDLGVKMCQMDKNLLPFIDGPRYHHEALDGSGYPAGLKGNNIPLVGQILKVADEYDAIVSKRQYKTHIGISDTLKIISDQAISPKEADALTKITTQVNSGKVNSRIVKALFKVVIYDVEYEIFRVSGYLDYLKAQVKRLEEIDHYYKKMTAAKKEKDREYYKAGVVSLLEEGENPQNYTQVLEEYRQALSIRQKKVDELYQEIKKIKSIKI